MYCRKCWVSGRVQGVYYRGTAQGRARALGVSGYARNLEDGRVEVLACGEAGHVTEFVEWLRVGPPAAQVTAVEVAEHQPEEWPTGFSTG